MYRQPDGTIALCQNCTPEVEEVGGLLETVFLNGTVMRHQTLAEIRARIEEQL